MAYLKILLLLITMIFFSETTYAEDCVDNNRTEQGTVNIIDGTCTELPIEPYPDRYDCGTDRKLVQGTADTCIEGTEVNDPGIWLPSVQECPPGERPKQGTEECIDIPSREPFLLSFCGVPNGNELWKSDGTDAGTEEVKDIYLGSPSSNPDYLTYINDTLFFSADQFPGGTELWKSDGTTDSTSMVKDIFVGGSASVKNLVNINGTLFFQAENGTHGDELWKSDGTPEGTSMVKDIKVGSSSSNPTFLTDFGGTLFFQANDGSGNELWKSDGINTVKVKDRLLNVQQLEVSNENLFFRANEAGGDELFMTTDGTNIVMLTDVGGSKPSDLTDVDGTLFFAANDGVAGNELWKSDGTTGGTDMIENINPPGAAGSAPDELANINGILYFTADDGTHGRELWKSDGTTTVLVKDINEGSDSNATELTNVNGTVFFSADNGVNGRELWKSDGTTVGTVIVKDLDSGSSNPHDLKNINGILYFKTDDDNTIEELWKSDGTSAGTVLLKSGCIL